MSAPHISLDLLPKIIRVGGNLTKL